MYVLVWAYLYGIFVRKISGWGSLEQNSALLDLWPSCGLINLEKFDASYYKYVAQVYQELSYLASYGISFSERLANQRASQSPPPKWFGSLE